MNNSYSLQAKKGYYGKFGGCFMPELLIAPIQEIEKAFQESQHDPEFHQQLNHLLENYAGRPTPITEIPHFSQAIDGPRIFLKREDLLHTGAHKLNNALGQVLLAQRLGKKRIIAETGAGQHGVATAAAAAYLGLSAVIYMGSHDKKRQSANVLRMELMGAEVISVDQGSGTLKDAVNEALRDWSSSFKNSYYCLGSALGPHPYPEMVATFQSVIGKESLHQCLKEFGSAPDYVVASVGGGSNAIGIFSSFLNNEKVHLIGVEAGGHGKALGEHAARFQSPSVGVFHGCYSYLLQNSEGQIMPTSSISAGLDYPSVGPHHAHLFEQGRVEYLSVSDNEALAALKLLAKTEGILPALESAHALAQVMKIASSLEKNKKILISLSGRGDKDLLQIQSKK